MFGTIKALKLKLMEEMDTLVPPSLDFQLGYFSGKQSKKHSLIEEGDLKGMYAKDSRTSIFLWCDRVEEQSKEINVSVRHHMTVLLRVRGLN